VEQVGGGGSDISGIYLSNSSGTTQDFLWGVGMRVLVACEFSGIVRDAFAKRGHDAWSCDLLPTEKPGNHIQGDVLEILNDGWDLMIAHPPCTYLCAGGHNWMNRKPEWLPEREKALIFIRKLLGAPVEKIALENPIGVISSRIRKPDQIFRAWMFGHPYKKDVCLWLKNLPKLTPTHVPEGWLFGGDTYPKERKTLDFWSTDRYTATGGSKKSITFQGIANAMAEQWG
jgi:hypothetical protein